VTGIQFANQLGAQGLDPADIPVTAALFDTALAGFATLGATTPACGWWVPGRLEVFGKHTDYAGGRTLVAAVPRGFAFLASPRSDEVIHLLDARNGERIAFGSKPAIYTGWRHYAEVVTARLSRNFPGKRRGADIAFASNLPRASGMSSSSALVVGIASVLVRAWSLADRADWQENITDAAALATYYAALENGLTFRGLEGDAGVGTHGGSEDHAAMLLAVPGRISAFSFVPMRRIADAPVPDQWRFVIAASGVTAEKTGAARDAYNRLSDGASALLRLWNAGGESSPSLAAALASHPSAADVLRELIGTSDIPGWPPAMLQRRLEHFQREDARVPEALAAFLEMDVARLGEISEESQRDAERLLGNQIPRTIALARGARDCGAFAASSFGAGFGGSVWALVERDRALEFAAEWLARYHRGDAPAGASSFNARPGPPSLQLSC
jgi:galactokinase